MRYHVIIYGMLFGGLAYAQGPEKSASATVALTTAVVHSASASSITATGRIQAVKAAKIGPRISGRLAEFDETPAGALDVGMSVKKGQKLFVLDQSTFENAVLLAEAQLASAKAYLANLVAPVREEKMEQLKQEVTQLAVRSADKAKERDRYKRLVEEEKTLPPRRLEEVEVDLAALQAQKAAAEARFNEAQRGPTPSEIAVASARVKEAEAALQIARDDLRDATVTAPFDGVITQRFKSVGDYIASTPPTDVLELVNLDKLEAEIAIPEIYLPALQEKQNTITIKTALLSKPLVLPVTRVVEQVDASHGTFVARVAIPADARGRLVPGAFITAEIPLAGAGGTLAPARAVMMQDGKPYLFVAKDGKMQRRDVSLGEKLSEGVIVSAGLSDGETVVMGPSAQLADGKDLAGSH